MSLLIEQYVTPEELRAFWNAFTKDNPEAAAERAEQIKEVVNRFQDLVTGVLDYEIGGPYVIAAISAIETILRIKAGLYTKQPALPKPASQEGATNDTGTGKARHAWGIDHIRQ